MPNQLAQSKRRMSLVEHKAVLEALSEIACVEKTRVMELLREGVRDVVRKRARDPDLAARLLVVVGGEAPQMPEQFKTAAQLARFKRAQREFDRVVLDLQLVTPGEARASNSLVPVRRPVRLINFAQAHASSI